MLAAILVIFIAIVWLVAIGFFVGKGWKLSQR